MVPELVEESNKSSASCRGKDRGKVVGLGVWVGVALGLGLCWNATIRVKY